jgi:anti-anti-sigma regulatory factor
MRYTQRTVLLAILAFGSFVSTLVSIVYLLIVRDQLTAGVIICDAVIGWVLVYSYWRGWEPARYVGAASALLASVATVSFSNLPLSFGMLIAPIVVLILGGPRWLIANTVLILGIGVARGVGSFRQPTEVAYYLLVVVGLMLIRTMVEIALRDARASAAAADEARQLAEQQARENAAQARQLLEQNERQGRLLALVDTLETPAVALADGVVLAPVMGALDSQRAARLTDRLLKQVYVQRARLIVLDIAGVPVVDTGVAHSIRQTTQSLRLLGCDVVITGISPQVAATLAQLGVGFDGVQTARSPQDVLAARLRAA